MLFLVARIAFDELTNDHPTVLAKANTVLSHLATFTTFEKDHAFVECATFADEAKTRGWDDQADWHFIDTPLYVDGFYAEAPQEPENITWALVLTLVFNI